MKETFFKAGEIAWVGVSVLIWIAIYAALAILIFITAAFLLEWSLALGSKGLLKYRAWKVKRSAEKILMRNLRS